MAFGMGEPILQEDGSEILQEDGTPILQEGSAEVLLIPGIQLSVEELRVRSLDVDRNEISWRINDTQEEVHDYTFQVLRSESPAGPYEKISLPFEDRYLFYDSRIPPGDKFRVLYYKVRVTRKSDSAIKDFGPSARIADPDLVANAIRRSELTLLTQAVGRQVWFFPRRTFGHRCSSCWDSTLSTKKRSNCLECFDTSYLRGYLDPIEIYVQIDPSTKGTQLQSMQKGQDVLTSARTSFYPTIKPGDVLVELENKRWRVVTVTPSERLRATIKQELTLREIEATDIEFRLPINLSNALRDVQTSPNRMFSNPVNMDNVIDELAPDAFALFPTYPTDLDE